MNSIKEEIETWLYTERLISNEEYTQLKAIPKSVFYTTIVPECNKFRNNEINGFRYFLKMSKERNYRVPRLNTDQMQKILSFMLRINK